MDSKFKNWKAMVFAGLTAAVALPLAVGANAALDSGSFTVKSVNSEDSSIVAYAGVEPRIGSGEIPGPGPGGEGEDKSVSYSFTVNMEADKCLDYYSYINTEGVSENATIISPSGESKPLEEGMNEINETGQWSIKGTFTKLGKAPNGGYSLSMNDCLVSVDEWNNPELTDMSNAFAYADNLVSVPNNLPSTVTDISGMFRGTTKFDQNINSWDTSNVLKVDSMFREAKAFNQPIDSWEMSQIKDLSGMFAFTEKFDQDISQWNVSNVENMTEMFYTSESFNKSLNGWDLSSAKYLNGMFEYSVYNQDLDQWVTTKVTNMSRLFSGTSFNKDITGWDTSSVEDMSFMFSGNRAFNKNTGNWNVSNLKNAESLFAWAQNLSVDLSKWDVKNVTNNKDWNKGTFYIKAPVAWA